MQKCNKRNTYGFLTRKHDPKVDAENKVVSRRDLF